MASELFDLYSGYSTTDLLKIIQQADQYQPAAVETAKEVLSSRTISPEEYQFAANVIPPKDSLGEKITGYTEKSHEWIQPLINPQAAHSPDSYYKGFVTITALLYAYILFVYSREVIFLVKMIRNCQRRGNADGGAGSYWNCLQESFNLNTLLILLAFIYMPVIVYLVYKKSKAGWIAVVTERMLTLVGVLVQLYFSLSRGARFYGNPVTYFVGSGILFAFLYFAAQEPILSLYTIDRPLRNKTLRASAIGSVILVVLLYGAGSILYALFS